MDEPLITAPTLLSKNPQMSSAGMSNMHSSGSSGDGVSSPSLPSTDYRKWVETNQERLNKLSRTGWILSLLWVAIVVGGVLFLVQRQEGTFYDFPPREWILWLLVLVIPLLLVWVVMLYLRQIQGLKFQLEWQVMRLEAASAVDVDQAGRRIQSVAMSLLDRANELSRAESITSDKLRNMIESLQSQTSTIQGVATTITDSTKNLGADYTRLIEQIQGAGAALEEQRRSLSELVESASAVLSQSERQAVSWSERMSGVVRLAKDAAEGLGGVRDLVNNQARALEESIIAAGSVVQKNWSSLQEVQDRQIQNLHRTSDQLLNDANVITERLEGSLTQLQDVSQSVDEASGQVVARLRVDHQGLAQTLEEAQGLTEGLTQRMKSHFGEVDGYLEQALQQVDEVAALLGDDRSGVVMQLRTVLAQIDDCSGRFTTQAANLVSASKIAAEKANELDARYRNQHKTLFVESASHILETLHSHSLDIARMIGEEITDADLRKFMAGDRSIFTRALAKRNVTILARVLGQEIAASSQARDNVLRFMGQFEEFLQEARAADARQIVSTSILASDLGKMYMVLSHVLEN